MISFENKDRHAVVRGDTLSSVLDLRDFPQGTELGILLSWLHLGQILFLHDFFNNMKEVHVSGNIYYIFYRHSPFLHVCSIALQRASFVLHPIGKLAFKRLIW